ncbi:tail fiber domain-containing protein [Parachryseolinea silvisoli]|uniref:tail fiber domain-containing protein n=1 Tax=Parachryseolinea silvisoli TaxID=2873601 RepID=UPI002265860E|nr:tail fiber domain-containing protein [Parachryseolinea silvisoli]MCD9018045.1 tail fiber domain-containing protein [Parachryseolinea silvisoli]
MKTNFSILVFMLAIAGVAQAQVTTYGTGAGTVGTRSAYYGIDAGRICLPASVENTALGYQSLYSNTSGGKNTAIGTEALYFTTTGTENTAVGYRAGYKHTTGAFNTAVGSNCMVNLTDGGGNSAFGNGTLYYATSAFHNTALGANAMSQNTTGSHNTATGAGALYRNTTGGHNTAIGINSMFDNIFGTANTAGGSQSLSKNTSGNENTAQGYQAMYTNTTGSYNTAVGRSALYNNLTGSDNTAVGSQAGPSSANTNLSNTTAIGSGTAVTASNQVRIGNSAVTSIGGQVSWSTLSDGRFKKDLQENVAGLDFINKLHPVSYVLDYDRIDKFLGIPDSVSAKNRLNRKAAVRQAGFIAQEVNTLVKETGYTFSGVETPQNDNDAYAIRYSDFVVPLVKAVQELSARVDKLTAELLEKKQSSVLSTTAAGAALFQNGPNPFSQTTAIDMIVPDAAQQPNLIIYSLDGKQVSSIPVSGRGKTSVQIQGNQLPAGIYYYALTIDGQLIDVKKMVITDR